jgi:cholesterol oxidase
VSFDEGLELPGDGLPDPSASKRFTNAQGVEQGTCVHCGQCDVGCTYDAKNTLDRTYIPLGLAKGMEVRPLHLVKGIEPAKGGYTVHFDRLEGGARIPGAETAAKVVVAAGSLGSTELLLRCRDEFRTLKGLSPRLGKGWCSNGDFLTPAHYGDREIHPTHGPTITSAIDFQDGSQGPRFWIQDGGFFNLMGMEAQTLASCNYGGRLGQLVGLLRERLTHTDPFAHVMPWFAQGVDSPGGVMRLKKRWYFFGPKDFRLDWDVARSTPVIDAIVAMHRKLTEATGGTALVPPSWSLCKDLVTPHPLGGCGMGTSPRDGVVDHSGQAFGHPGLYVADGSVFPRPLGVNPSRTIAALAERTASLMAV